MKTTKFILPTTSISILENVIKAYRQVDRAISSTDLAKIYKKKLTLQGISGDITFLQALGILTSEKGHKHRLTPLGMELANALINEPERSIEVTKLWLKVITKNQFFKEIYEYISANDRVEINDLHQEIISKAGRKSTSSSGQGASTVINILSTANLIKLERGRYKVKTVYALSNETTKFSSLTYPDDLRPFLEKFHADHPVPSKCVFVMMKFEATKIHKEIFEAIKSIFFSYGFTALRADNKSYSEDLLPNIRTYMHGCSIGLALFERITKDIVNPNVSLEVGYMMALGKPTLLLKDSTIPILQTDLIGRLYQSFDTQNPKETLAPIIEAWLKEKSFL